jgi:hypothetical protein
MVAVGLTVGSGVGVGVAGTGAGVAGLPQAVSRRQASSRRMDFVRTWFLQGRMQVFYLILKAQSATGAL